MVLDDVNNALCRLLDSVRVAAWLGDNCFEESACCYRVSPVARRKILKCLLVGLQRTVSISRVGGEVVAGHVGVPEVCQLRHGWLPVGARRPQRVNCFIERVHISLVIKDAAKRGAKVVQQQPSVGAVRLDEGKRMPELVSSAAGVGNVGEFLVAAHEAVAEDVVAPWSARLVGWCCLDRSGGGGDVVLQGRQVGRDTM